VPLFKPLSPLRRSIMLSTWGLFAGLSLVMLSGGIFSTLLGVRAELEDLPTIISCSLGTSYYAGFLLGSWYTLRALDKWATSAPMPRWPRSPRRR